MKNAKEVLSRLKEARWEKDPTCIDGQGWREFIPLVLSAVNKDATLNDEQEIFLGDLAFSHYADSYDHQHKKLVAARDLATWINSCR